jgi:hypothetical protein
MAGGSGGGFGGGAFSEEVPSVVGKKDSISFNYKKKKSQNCSFFFMIINLFIC